MRKSILALALAAGACLAVPATAQETMETVAVTGYRANAESVPYITVSRRADHIFTTVRVICDTRDAAKRKAEMRDTLRAMIREAANDRSISLSVGETVLRDFTEELIDKIIVAGSLTDTSRAELIVKTTISPSDTFDSATNRIVNFVKRVPVYGRAEVLNDKDWELAVVGPQQYHAEVIAKIAANAKETAGLFGPEYGVQIEGLERPLQWYRSGQLDLALYIPYSMTIQRR
jgi:hypothetical protein